MHTLERFADGSLLACQETAGPHARKGVMVEYELESGKRRVVDLSKEPSEAWLTEDYGHLAFGMGHVGFRLRGNRTDNCKEAENLADWDTADLKLHVYRVATK